MNPPKEKDTPKEAANELEEILTDLLVALDNFPEDVKQSFDIAKQELKSLINKQRQEAYNEGYSNGGFDAYNQVITYAYQDRAARLIEPDNLALACKNMRGRLKELESKEEANND